MFVRLTAGGLATAETIRVVWFPGDDDRQPRAGEITATLRKRFPPDQVEIEIPADAGGPNGGIVRIMAIMPNRRQPLFVARFTVAAGGAGAKERPPEAVLNMPTQARFGESFVLDGSYSSSPAARFEWTILDGQTNYMIMNRPIVTNVPSFNVAVTPDFPLPLGVHHFRLVVTDPAGNASAPAIASVTVVDATPPTANLRAPAQVDPGQDVALDGSRSFDVGGGRVTSYEWTHLRGAGGSMQLGTPYTTATSSYQAASPSNRLQPGTHVFRLVVRDDAGNVSAPALTRVVVGTP